MGKMFKLFGIITVAAVIGFSFVSCGGTGSPAGGGNGGSTWDAALNGSWNEAGMGEFVFSNGNWEYWWISSGTRAPADRGTVTTSGNRMTLTTTHVSGTAVVAMVPEAHGHVNPNAWYSRSQLSSLATTIFGMATTDVERLLHQVFGSSNITYSITSDGNTLFMTWLNNVTRTFTRVIPIPPVTITVTGFPASYVGRQVYIFVDCPNSGIWLALGNVSTATTTLFFELFIMEDLGDNSWRWTNILFSDEGYFELALQISLDGSSAVYRGGYHALTRGNNIIPFTAFTFFYP